jgi:hypothetical protein
LLELTCSTITPPPARALLTTAKAVLAKQGGNISAQNGNELSLSYEGAIFLPVIIRSPSLGDEELVEVCRDLSSTVLIVPIESFYAPVNPMMYNLTFLVVRHNGANLQLALQDVLRDACPLIRMKKVTMTTLCCRILASI